MKTIKILSSRDACQFCLELAQRVFDLFVYSIDNFNKKYILGKPLLEIKLSTLLLQYENYIETISQRHSFCDFLMHFLVGTVKHA